MKHRLVNRQVISTVENGATSSSFVVNEVASRHNQTRLQLRLDRSTSPHVYNPFVPARMSQRPASMSKRISLPKFATTA